MMISLRWLPLFLCIALFSGQSPAEVGNETQAPWYEIELIVFARNHPGASNTEKWSANPGTPDWGRASPLQPGISHRLYGIEGLEPTTGTESSTGSSSQAVENPAATQLLPKSAYKLLEQANRLQGADGQLETLMHLAWRQPVLNREKAEWLYLRAPSVISTGAGSASQPRLDGTLRVSLSRYLHIDLDLLLRRLAAPGAMQAASSGSSGEAGILGPSYRNYRFQAHRRMRSGELHYIDHPLMGVLVQITPYELPKPASKEATTPHQLNITPSEVGPSLSPGNQATPLLQDAQ